MEVDPYSILTFFRGSTVLLTGSSGYVGGLVLERLLRSTSVKKVFVLLRAKRGEDIRSRLVKMLQTAPQMHLLRGNEVLDKVVPVAGDMTAAGLGISPTDRLMLQLEVQVVIHCAADIRLESNIQELLRANYEGTRQLLALASSFNDLRSFVHVSSAYTNMNAPPGSLVGESLYRLAYGDQPVNDQDLVQELLSMPAHNANLRAEGLLAQWNFPNNYTLSKHLAEYMVADTQRALGLPVAIVRPTLISSVARDPYPGYTGNYAGHVGATLAFMAGLFNTPAASNYKAVNVWDVIPADVCVNTILAAAAALGNGSARACAIAPLHASPGAQQPRQQEKQQPRQQRDALRRDQGCQGSSTEQQQPLLIVHCGSSTTYPLTIMESWNWGVEVYGAWPMVPNLVWGKCAGPLYASHEPNPTRAAYHIWLTGLKIWLAAKLLTWFKRERLARKLTVGFESFKVINQPKTDVNLRFSTLNMQRLAALLHPAEQEEFLLLWKPQLPASSTSSTPSSVLAATKLAEAATAAPATAAVLTCKGEGQATAAPGESAVCSPIIRARISLAPKQRCSSLQIDSSPSSAASAGEFSDSETASDSDCCAGSVASSVASSGRVSKGAAGAREGAVLSAELQEEVRKMRGIPIEWRSFHINLGAFLYCTLFGMDLPPAQMPISKPEVASWLHIRRQDQVITHNFKLYK